MHGDDDDVAPANSDTTTEIKVEYVGDNQWTSKKGTVVTDPVLRVSELGNKDCLHVLAALKQYGPNGKIDKHTLRGFIGTKDGSEVRHTPP